jgi:hypothetical protein
MTPTDLLDLPHTADEALEVLRAYEPAKAEVLRRAAFGHEVQCSARG